MARLWLVTMVSVLVSAQAFALSAEQTADFFFHPLPQHPAGCHGHGSTAPENPSPVPTSYQCCVNGHHAAIPNASFTLRSATAQLWALNSVDKPSLDFVSSLASDKLLALSNSPPGFAPLRI